MRFAVALPWWGYVLAFAAALACAWWAYARVAVALTRGQRALLTGLRALTLLLLVVCPAAAGARSCRRPARATASCRSWSMSRAACASPMPAAPRIERARALARELQQRSAPSSGPSC